MVKMQLFSPPLFSCFIGKSSYGELFWKVSIHIQTSKLIHTTNHLTWFYVFNIVIKQFHASVLFLYPLKAYLTFSCAIKMEQWHEMCRYPPKVLVIILRKYSTSIWLFFTLQTSTISIWVETKNSTSKIRPFELWFSCRFF